MPAVSEMKHLEQTATIDYKYEFVRKGIHLFSLSIPAIYFFISRTLALEILVPITAAFIVTDTARYYIPPVSRWFYRWFGWLLRKHETNDNQKRLNGASNVLISATLCVLLFPRIIAINAFTILIISDTTSALIGRRYGKHRFLGKSLEGSLAFFISAVLVILIAPKASGSLSEYAVGITGALVGAVVEALPIRLDDNLTIPLAVGLFLWGMYFVFLPAIILFPVS